MKRLKKYQGILGGSSVGNDGGTYKVKKGDTFYGIANDFNVDWDELIKSNPNLDEKARNHLIPGQSILVPGLKTQSSVLDLPTMYDFLDQAGVVYEPPSRQASNSLLDAAAKAAKNKAKGTKINKVIEAKKKKRDDDAAVMAAWKDDLKINENSTKVGYKGGRWYPHGSLEPGNRTIAYGHKLTDKERDSKAFAGGLSEKQADMLLDKDMAIHLNAFRNEFNKKFGPGSYDKLSLNEKVVGADYHFNGLPVEEFKKFFTAMHQGNVDRMKKEYVRKYTDKKLKKKLPLKQRNTWTRKTLGWEKQDGGIVSEYGWDYKKDGDNYLTRRTGNEDWITARGNALDAIKSKIFNEGPQMSQEEAEVSHRQEWMDRVRRYINRGMTLDDLAPLMGTRRGILQYFPELANEAVNQNVDQIDEDLSIELDLYDAGEMSLDDLSSEAIDIIAEKERKAWRKEREQQLQEPIIQEEEEAVDSDGGGWTTEEEHQKMFGFKTNEPIEESIEESMEVDDEGTSIELDLYRSGEISIDDLSPEAFDIIAEEERKDYRSNREKKIEEVVESPWRDNLRQEYLKSNEELFTQGNPFDQAPAENEADDYYQNLFQRLKDIDQQKSVEPQTLYDPVTGQPMSQSSNPASTFRDLRTPYDIQQQELRDAETADYETVTQPFMQENFPIVTGVVDQIGDGAKFIADEVEDVVDKLQKTSILPGYITNDAEALYNFGSHIVNKDYEALINNKYGQKLALKILDQNENPNKYMGLRFKTLTDVEQQWLRRGLEKVGAIDTPDFKLGNVAEEVVEETPAPETFTRRIGDVKDSYAPEYNLMAYRNQWDNGEGFVYKTAPTKQHRKDSDEYEGVLGVAHFLLDASVDSEYPYSHKNNAAFIENAIANDDWIPAFEQLEGNRVRLKYKKPDDILETDIVNTPLRQLNFSDIDFKTDQTPKGFKSSVHEVTTKDGDGTLLLFKNKDGYSRFSGGSVVFIFEDKYGNVIVRDFAGSLNSIQKEGNSITKQYNLKPGQLTIGYHDVGSFSAKPKANKNNVLKAKQWEGYNDAGYTGGALLIPAPDDVELLNRESFRFFDPKYTNTGPDNKP